MENDNNNKGVLFKNDRKEKENHPDYRGNIEVDGKEYYIKGWKKTWLECNSRILNRWR